MLILDPPTSLEQAVRQRDDLAKVLHRLGIEVGLLNADVPCDGPTLLMATEGYVDHLASEEMSHPVLQSALREAYAASGDLEHATGRRSDPLYRLIEGMLVGGEDEPVQIAVQIETLAETLAVLRDRMQAAVATTSAPSP